MTFHYHTEKSFICGRAMNMFRIFTFYICKCMHEFTYKYKHIQSMQVADNDIYTTRIQSNWTKPILNREFNYSHIFF